MELKQLRHFLAAAETGSFSTAAQRAFVTQPALSASIAKLEAGLETKLFLRNKRGVALTLEGQRLLETARLVLAECSKARRDVKRLQARETVRIGVINTLSVLLIARLLQHLRVEHPDIAPEIIDAPPAEIGRLVAEGKVDVALNSLAGDAAASSKKMEFLLFGEPFVLLIPPEHPLKGRKTVALSDLKGESFIARMNCENRFHVTEDLKASGIKLRVVCRTHQDERAIALVESGLGVAILPRHAAKCRAHAVAFADKRYSRNVVLVQVASKPSNATERFISFARAASWP